MFISNSGKLNIEISNCIAKYENYFWVKGHYGNPAISLLSSLYRLLPDVQEKSISLGAFKASVSFNGVFSEVKEILRGNIIDLSKVFSKEEVNLLLDNYRELVEYCLDFYNSDKSLHYTGEISQPSQLTRFCLELASFNKGDNIYNPFCGLASYPVNNGECFYEGDEISLYTWALSQINLQAHDCKAYIRCQDAFTTLESKEKYYDGVIMTPPFSMSEENRTEIDAVRLAVENKLKVGGKMVAVLPISFLFSSSKAIIELREMLLAEGYLNMIVTLPNIFVPFADVKTCILSISKTRNDSCLLVDGSSFYGEEKGAIRKVLLVDQLLSAIKSEDRQYCVRVDNKNLMGQSNLMPSTYFPLKSPSDYPTKRLGDLISVYRLVKDGNTDIDEPIKLISARNLTIKDIDLCIDIATLDDAKPRNLHRIVDSHSFLLFPTEKGMRFGRIKNIPGNMCISCSPNIHTAKIQSDEITEEYLMLQLSSDFVAKQLSSNFFAAIHGVLPYTYFINLRIPVPSLEEQAKLLQAYYQANMSEKEKALAASMKKYESQIHLRKHAMSQNLSAMSALWNKLNTFRLSNNGNLSDNDVVSIAYKMKVRDLFDAITHRINTLLVQTDNLANIEYNWGEDTLINPSFFIYDYVRRHRDVRFMFVEGDICNVDKTKGIFFSEKALERVFDNIVSNAISYGFNDTTRVDYKIFFEVIIEDLDCYKVRISNNGTPLPNDMDTDDVFAFGYSSALNEADENGHEHMGLGAFEVRNILDEFGASVEFISTPENEYTVTYEITFTKTNLGYE